MPRDLLRSGSAGLVVLPLWLACGPVRAQLQTSVAVPERGHGAISVTFQHAVMNERSIPRVAGGGVQDFGEIVRRTALLELDYGLSDRLAVNLALPFHSHRYRGDFPHDPRTLIDPRGQRFLDDGDYHSNWGDWALGLRWQWTLEPIAVTPFVTYHAPSHDYPLFTETQAGTRQWQLDLGLNAGARLGRSNLYWQAGYAYSRKEKTRPRGHEARRVDHGVAHVELGWIATLELTLRLHGAYRWTYNALEFPTHFSPPPLTERDDLFYYHDQLFDWEYGTASLGASYRLGSDYTVSFDYGRTVALEWGHKTRRALTLGISRAF